MTELMSGRPVVRLPKKRESMMMERTVSMKTLYRALVSDRLYTEGIPSTVSENDILDLVQSCDPIEVQLNRVDGTGYIQFSSIDKADRAYTLFNDATLKNEVPFQLKISSSGDYQEPETTSGIHQVRNLPLGTTNHHLYDLFRPFGPMSLCKIIMDHQGKGFKGTALIQYFNEDDAEMALKTMNNQNIQGNNINVYPFVPKKSRPHSGEVLMFLQQPQQQLHSISTTKTLNGNSTIGNNNSDGESGSNIDYTNLYIKNLDLDVKSRDLFKYFRDYGHIVSARVMRNPETDKSKGFGFVSFSRAEEAHWALREMNNKYILSKPIIVAFHEPKKPRTEKNGRSHDMVRRFSTPGIPPHPPPPYMPVAPSISEYIDYSKPSPQSGFPSRRPPITTHGTAPAAISMVNENFSNGKKRHSTMTHIPTISTPATQHNTNAFTPSPPLVSSLQKQQQRPQPQPQQPQLQLTPPPQQPQYHHHTNPITLNHQPQQPQQQTKQSALIRRRSSNESVCSSLTETTPDLQKQRMTDAVIRMGVKHNVEDIVFMLLTLKRKERSLCLFNQNFLREQIKLARSALEIFKDDDEEDGRVDSPPTPVAQSPFPIPITTTSPQTPPLQQRVSRAIPIVAPPPSAQPISTTTDAKLAKIAPENIDQFLVSIQSLPATQQKEKLGDQLFPHVKATGVRHAPKVTVRLLDTIPLSELAHIMYDKVALKTRVDIAVASLRQ